MEDRADHLTGEKMALQPDTTPKAVHRYPGLSSFGVSAIDRKLFFGRGKESRDLANQVSANRLTVLYAKSGLGKTSLLQAGVFPRLLDAGILPLRVRINSPNLNAVLTLRQNIESELQQEHNIGSGIEMSARSDTGSWWEFFKTTVFWRDDQALIPCLVLDQFEEIFTLHGSETRDAIARELSHLVNGSLPLQIREGMRDGSKGYSEAPPDMRIILSLRTEYVGQLQELFSRIPSILSRRFILLPLTRERAQQAIEEPARLPGDFYTRPFSYHQEAVDALLDYLGDEESGAIEPYQLQLQCQEVERKVTALQSSAAGDPVVVDKKLLGNQAELDRVVTRFYKRTLDALHDTVFHSARNSGKSSLRARSVANRTKRKARELCELGLLSDQGHRWHLGLEQIQQKYGLLEQELEFLVNRRLLRKEEKLHTFSFELAHDSLAAPIFNARPYRLSRRAKMGLLGGAVGAGIVIVSLVVLARDAAKSARIAKLEEESVSRLNTAYTTYAQVDKSRIDGLERINEELREELQDANDQIKSLIDKNTTIAAVLETVQQQPSLDLVQRTQLTVVQHEAETSERILSSLKKTTDRGRGRGQSKLAKSRIPLPEMVYSDMGKYRMGNTQGQSDETPVHAVTIIKAFEIGKYEVTFEQYDAFALATGRELPDDQGWGRGKRPVINVSWEDAVAYANWLSEQTGREYRLPSEAEWEYAARAGSVTQYWWGDDIEQNGKAWANCRGCGSPRGNKETAPVGSFEGNDYGLHDTAGNVWEWVQDCYSASYETVPSDGSPYYPDACERRVLRGGSWRTVPHDLRSTDRYWKAPGYRSVDTGFRLARSL
ncbi:MAG: formylglycine-generating enzyme family protein [Pseudomonadota bacterium]